MGNTNNWHDEVFLGIHYDLHAGTDDTLLGRDITHEHIRERLLTVKPDWIQWDCKGHPGYASWPTVTGSAAPGIVKDMLKVVRDVTGELGIKLGMHYSGVWDVRALELHPEWAVIDNQGVADKKSTCRLSPYLDRLMIPQLLEVIDKYDIDGFWVDGDNWASTPCWCERCRNEFTKRTGITAIPLEQGDESWSEWLAFQRQIFVEYVTKYAEAVHTHKPGCLACSNWMYTFRQPDAVTAPIDYISGDYNWNWGADKAAVEGRVIDSRDMSWDLMCWTFYRSGEQKIAEQQSYPWTMKTAIHLKQEVTEVVALGGAIMLYNLPQRSGWLTGWHQELIAEVAEFCRARKEVCLKTESASEIAILHLASHYYEKNSPLFNIGDAADPVEGALHLLLQTQLSADIITEADVGRKLGNYKLIIVPEQTRLSPCIIEQLTSFAEQGGQLLMSGSELAEYYPEITGVNAAEKLDNIYLPIAGKATPLAGKSQIVLPGQGTKVLTCALIGQDISHDSTNKPVATSRKLGHGVLTAIYGNIFAAYINGHYPLIRQYVKSVIDSMQIAWLTEVKSSSRLEVVLRRKNDLLLINLLNRGAGIMTNNRQPIIEELPPVTDVTVTVKSSTCPASVRCLPDNNPVDWSYASETVTIHLKEVKIHAIIELE
ncbi:MAG: alpha-L-fucosidase [Victivallaceae bacterium]|nr:alpha-L-fucosidase [Victivallaceae bacterium]